MNQNLLITDVFEKILIHVALLGIFLILQKPETRNFEEEASAYFTKMYFDHDRQLQYNNSINIPKASIPSILLDLEPPSFNKFSTTLKRC